MKKKVLMTLGLILILILNMVLSIGILIPDALAAGESPDSKAAGGRGSVISTATEGVRIEGPDPNGYGYYIYEGDFETTQTHGEALNPAYGDYQMYCAHENIPADIFIYDMTKAEAEALNGTAFSGRGHPAATKEGLVSTTFFEYAGTTDAAPWEAYIVSDDPQGAYSDEKQDALWGKSNSLYQESQYYQDFDNKVRPKIC